MKIGAAAALVGAVVAEVTKSEDGGLGARLLAGSYYGQTVQIWAALFAAAALSAVLVGLIGLAGRVAERRMALRAMRRAPPRRSSASARCSALAVLGDLGSGGAASATCPRSSCRRPRRSRCGFVDLDADARRRFPADHPGRARRLRHRLAAPASSSPSSSTARRSCSAACCRSAIWSPRCRSSASRRSW